MGRLGAAGALKTSHGWPGAEPGTTGRSQQALIRLNCNHTAASPCRCRSELISPSLTLGTEAIARGAPSPRLTGFAALRKDGVLQM